MINHKFVFTNTDYSNINNINLSVNLVLKAKLNENEN